MTPHLPASRRVLLVALLALVALYGYWFAPRPDAWVALLVFALPPLLLAVGVALRRRTAGFWAASWPLGFHAITRHDGVLSVLRGFTGAELARLVREATGASPTVARRAGWRLTAEWTPRERTA